MSKLGQFVAACAAMVLGVSVRADVDITFDPSVADYKPILREAITNAEAGAVITLSEGVYPLASSLTVDRAITLRGAENGGTVLKATGTGYNVLGVSNGATIERLAITGGSRPSGWGGNGVGVNISAGTLSQCVITNNSYTGAGNAFGVGVFAEVASSKTVKITRCRICDNRAAAGSNTMPGVGLYVKGSGTFRMDNCLVTGNVSTKGGDNVAWAGGGMYINHSNAQVVNCTFADNSHNNRGGGVNIGGGTPKFYNCIIARNSASRDPCIHRPDVSASTLTDGCISATITNGFFNTLVSKGVPPIGPNGLAADPLFKADGYELKNGSPAIGTGRAVTGITDGVDLNGTARDPESVDLGCFKYVPTIEFSVQVEIGATKAFTDEPMAVTVTYFNVPAGKTLVNHYYAVSDTETNALECVGGKVVIGRPGTWKVRVVVTDDEGELASEESPTTVKVGVHKAYVTSRADATPEFPYVTPETAATCFNDVTEQLCIDGTEIELDAGLHTIRAQNAFSCGVHIYGQGRDLTWINANKKDGVFYANHADFVLENLSVTNFYNVSGAGVYIAAGGGTVRNCRFAHSDLHISSINLTGMVIYANAAQALVENCIFEHLTYNQNGNIADGIAVRMASGKVRNCLFRDIECDDVGAADSIASLDGSAVLENCTFADCRVKHLQATKESAFSFIKQNSGNGTVRNVLCTRMTPVDGDEARWGYFEGYTKNLIHNCCCEGETEYGLNPVDGTKIEFKANEPYHLRVMSSCRNAGQTQEWMTGATDLDGNPRIHGKAVDVGCYECQEGPGLILLFR